MPASFANLVADRREELATFEATLLTLKHAQITLATVAAWIQARPELVGDSSAAQILKQIDDAHNEVNGHIVNRV